MQGAALVDGCEEPAPPGRGEARGSRARGRLPRARRPSCRRGPAAREPSCAARTLRRRRGAGGRRRGAPRPAPGGAQMRLRAARYVVRIRTVKILYYHCGDLSWTDSIVAFDRLVPVPDGSPRGSAAATSGSRDNPVPAATGRTLHRARPPSPFPPAPPPPHVCACAVLREPQP
jgi:hypothetical protein